MKVIEFAFQIWLYDLQGKLLTLLEEALGYVSDWVDEFREPIKHSLNKLHHDHFHVRVDLIKAAASRFDE